MDFHEVVVQALPGKVFQPEKGDDGVHNLAFAGTAHEVETRVEDLSAPAKALECAAEDGTLLQDQHALARFGEGQSAGQAAKAAADHNRVRLFSHV